MHCSGDSKTQVGCIRGLVDFSTEKSDEAYSAEDLADGVEAERWHRRFQTFECLPYNFESQLLIESSFIVVTHQGIGLHHCTVGGEDVLLDIKIYT